MPKSKEQYEEMRQKSQEAIIKAALNLFVEKGYHATSISMIAKEASIANGLMYHYFKSKEDLLSEMMLDFFRQIQTRAMHELRQAGSSDIRIVIDALFSAVVQCSEPWRLIIPVLFQPDVAQSAKKQIEEMMTHQQELYQRYYAGKGVPDPQGNAAALSAVVHGVMLAFALNGDQDQLRLVREKAIEKML